MSADANADLGDGDLESAVGGDTLDELARRTGLSRAEIVSRLKTALPETINRSLQAADYLTKPRPAV